MKKVFIFFFSVLPLILFAQVQPSVRIPDAGGTFDFRHSDDISQTERSEIIKMLKANAVNLSNAGVDLRPNNNQIMSFIWPLRQAAGFNDNGFYGISNYVDHNPAVPNMVLDYNCGNRTYDQASGYNHAGTDIFTWPFAWSKMDADAVEVIAAAPGVVIGKADNNYDRNCSFGSGAWNAVYIQHADGSVAWYGHLKKGSVTSKMPGQAVSAGEYLGVVGSSGNSTGPHLHFEVYTNSTYTKLVDPWNGSCNSLNPGQSWWANQEPYRVSTLNTILTHGALPQLSGCGVDAMRVKTVFAPNDPIHFGSYFRDPIAGQVTTHKVYTPTDSLWNTWNHIANFSGNVSGWVYSFTLPANYLGTWRYEVTYNSQTLTRTFVVDTLPELLFTSSSLSSANVTSGDSVTLDFTVSNLGYRAANAHKVRFYVSQDTILTEGSFGDELIGEYDVTNSLAAGASATFSKKLGIPCKTAPGTNYIFLVADGTKIIAEYLEENNVDRQTISVVSGLPPINIVQDNTSVCNGASVTLTATGGTSYVWSPSAGLNTTTGATVIATPAVSTKYRVSGASAVCSNTDSVLISVLPLVTPTITLSYSGCPSATLQFQAHTTHAGSAAQYKWYVNNILSGTAGTHTVNNATNGMKVYAVLTSSAQCASPVSITSDTITVNCITTSVREIEGLRNYRIAPNPFLTEVTLWLEMNLLKPVYISVTDIKGRELYSSFRGKFSGSSVHTLSLKDLPVGTYFLKVQIGDSFFVERIMKMN